MGFNQKVYAVCKKIPIGKVATYGQIAHLIGEPYGARQVGWAMSACTDSEVPCHRVVNRLGHLSGADAFSFAGEQQELLRMEGIEVVEDQVDLAVYHWTLSKADEVELERILEEVLNG